MSSRSREELMAKGYSKEFLEDFFSCQSDEEETKAIRYTNLMKIRRERYERKRWIKQKERRNFLKQNDPVRYQMLLEREELTRQRYFQKLKSDPIRYAVYLAKEREKARRKRERSKFMAEKDGEVNRC